MGNLIERNEEEEESDGYEINNIWWMKNFWVSSLEEREREREAP